MTFHLHFHLPTPKLCSSFCEDLVPGSIPLLLHYALHNTQFSSYCVDLACAPSCPFLTLKSLDLINSHHPSIMSHFPFSDHNFFSFHTSCSYSNSNISQTPPEGKSTIPPRLCFPMFFFLILTCFSKDFYHSLPHVYSSSTLPSLTSSLPFGQITVLTKSNLISTLLLYHKGM